MATLTFFLHLSGAVMLLLFAVRMVRTSIERIMGPSFQRMVAEYQGSRIKTAFVGVILAIILQSATAAALLAAGFAASGVLGGSAAMAVVLGADLGSAIVIQILSFQLDWMIPALLAVGGWLYLKNAARTPRLIGRILLAVAFILLSLRLLGEATEPVREARFLPAILGYLSSDFVTAFLVGGAMTFLMHSSVAAILMCVTFSTIGILPVDVGISLVLGANLGSACLPVWLGRDMEPAARRVILGNLLLRGTAAVLALLVLNLGPLATWLPDLPPGQMLVTVHLGFNMFVLVVGLPVLGWLQKPVAAFVPQPVKTNEVDTAFKPVSALDEKLLGSTQLALGSLTREVLRMGQIVEVMAHPVMQLYQSGDGQQIKALQARDQDVNTAFSDIRRYVAKLTKADISKSEGRRARSLAEYAINLETAGDIIAKRLLPLAVEKSKTKLQFSEQGWEELLVMHDRVIANISLSFNALLYEDVDSARLLIEEKSEMAQSERKSRKKHLKRLRDGQEQSLETSDLHLETLRGLKDLNSQITSVAYPILHRHGHLRQTRLVDAMDEE